MGFTHRITGNCVASRTSSIATVCTNVVVEITAFRLAQLNSGYSRNTVYRCKSSTSRLTTGRDRNIHGGITREGETRTWRRPL